MSHYSYICRQLPLWLTIEIPNLCMYSCILRIHPPMALAHPLSNACNMRASMVCVQEKCTISCVMRVYVYGKCSNINALALNVNCYAISYPCFSVCKHENIQTNMKC